MKQVSQGPRLAPRNHRFRGLLLLTEEKQVKLMKRLMRHKLLVVIWVSVFAIGGYVAFSVLGTSKDGEENPYVITAINEAKTAETLNNQPKQPQNAKIGQAAQDGGLEFTVLGTKDNKETTIGANVYTQAEAAGRFGRLSITIKNIGNTPASLPLAAQKAFYN